MFNLKCSHVVASLLFVSCTSIVSAADCVLQVTRTACPGAEKESFSKCDGKASCEEKKPAISAAQCASKAKASCANSRLTVTKYKKVTAKYDGADIESGKDFCIGHPDYPYSNKPACKE